MKEAIPTWQRALKVNRQGLFRVDAKELVRCLRELSPLGRSECHSLADAIEQGALVVGKPKLTRNYDDEERLVIKVYNECYMLALDPSVPPNAKTVSRSERAWELTASRLDGEYNLVMPVNTLRTRYRDGRKKGHDD